MYKITYDDISNFLVNLEIIVINENYDKNILDVNNLKRVPTEIGLEMGMKIIEKETESGKRYSLLLYPENIQRLIVEHYTKNDDDFESEQ